MKVAGLLFGLLLVYLLARFILFLLAAIAAANGARKRAKADYREMLKRVSRGEYTEDE